jgi:hypothetical protein
MNKAFHTIFKNQGNSFLPAWSRLLPFYDAFITNPDSTQRQWALCIMDDVLEFCGEQSWGYQQHIREPLIAGMRDEIPANRQAACYGVGVAAQKGGPAWSNFVVECLPILFNVCQVANAREDDHVFATENACASIAKILASHQKSVPNMQQVLAAWISTLPVVNDEEAAPFAYMFLANRIDEYALLDALDTVILTSCRSNPALNGVADKAFLSICLALEAESIQGQVAQKVAASAKQLVQTAGIDANALLATLSPETQQALRAYFA